MATTVQFGGGELTLPGSASRIDTTSFESPSRGGLGVVYIVGHAEGGKPLTLTKHTSARDVKATYYDGDIVTAANIADNPGNDDVITGGASEIWVMKTNASTQATGVLQATSDPTAGSHQLANSGPYTFGPGDSFEYETDASGGAQSATFRGTAAAVTAAGAPTGAMSNEKLVLSVNGGGLQTIQFTTEANLTAVIATIEATLVGASSTDNGGALEIESAQYGSGSEIVIDASSTALTKLQLTAGTYSSAGPNDAVDLSAVTETEFKTRVESFGGVTVDITTAPPTIKSTSTGVSSQLIISASVPVSVNTNLGATAGTYNGAASGADVDVITLTSRDYGLHNNGIKCTLTDPSPTSSKRVVNISKTIDGSLVTQTSGTLGDQVRMTVEYTGAAGTSTMTTTATSLALTSSTGSESVTYSYSDYATIEELVTQINTTSVWSATAVSRDASTFLGADLDWVTAVDVSSAYSAYSRVYDIVNWVNTTSTLCTATREATGATVPDTTTGVYLTGAVRGTSSSSDWTGTALSAVSTENCNHIVPLIAEDNTLDGNNILWDSVAAAYKTHVEAKSEVSNDQRERRLWMGVKGNKATILSKLGDLNSAYVSLAADRQNLPVGRSGVLGDVPEWSTALIGASMRAAAETGESLTHKVIRTNGTTRDWSPTTEGETAELTNAGLMATFKDPDDKLTKFVDGVTTYSRSSNAALRHEEKFSGLLELSSTWRRLFKARYLGRRRAASEKQMELYSAEIIKLYGPRDRGGNDFLSDALNAQGRSVPGFDGLQIVANQEGDVAGTYRLNVNVYITPTVRYALHTIAARTASS